jgi:hypothetical protein
MLAGQIVHCRGTLEHGAYFWVRMIFRRAISTDILDFRVRVLGGLAVRAGGW